MSAKPCSPFLPNCTTLKRRRLIRLEPESASWYVKFRIVGQLLGIYTTLRLMRTNWNDIGGKSLGMAARGSAFTVEERLAYVDGDNSHRFSSLLHIRELAAGKQSFGADMRPGLSSLKTGLNGPLAD